MDGLSPIFTYSSAFKPPRSHLSSYVYNKSSTTHPPPPYSYLSFFHAVPVQVFNASEYRRRLVGLWKDATYVYDPPTHPPHPPTSPTHPSPTVAHSNRLVVLYLLNPPTHPPTLPNRCFNFQNEEAKEKLEEVHSAVIGDMVSFLDSNTTGNPPTHPPTPLPPHLPT